MDRFTIRMLAGIGVLVTLGACGSGGDDTPATNGNDPASPASGAPPVPAPITLAAPDLNRPAPQATSGNQVYRVADFYRNLIDQGAHFTLDGEFTGTQTTTQRQFVSRSARSVPPSPWLDRNDLTRTVITVNRFENGVASNSSIYAEYYDANNLFIGDRTRGESLFRVTQNGLSRPSNAGIGQQGAIGRLAIREPNSDTTIGYRDISWEMLTLSDGAPAYCEKSEELDTSNQRVFLSELCFGLNADGQSNQRVTYSFDSGTSTGSLVATDLAMGPAASSANGTDPADGAPIDPGQTSVQTSDKTMECLTTVDGPLNRAPLPSIWFENGQVPSELMIQASSAPFKFAQGSLFKDFQNFDTPVENFRWDAFEGTYIGTKAYQQGDESIEVTGILDDQLNISYFKKYTVNPIENTKSTEECYDGAVNRLPVPDSGPPSVLQCTGRVFPYLNTTIAHSLVVSGGRIAVTPSDNLLDAYEIDLLLVNEHNQYSNEGSIDTRKLEVLPDGWRRWSETKIRLRQSQQDLVVEFDDQWNIRLYSRRGSDTDRNGDSNDYECK